MAKFDVVELTEWSSIKELKKLKLDTLVTKKRELDEQYKDIEAQRKEVGNEIAAALVVAGVKSVKCNGLRVTQVDGRSASRIDQKRLLEKGVSTDVIEYATIPGTQYISVQIKELKEGE